jgi:hypothetical protein
MDIPKNLSFYHKDRCGAGQGGGSEGLQPYRAHIVTL